MKTTVDIATMLLEDAKRQAAEDGTTLRELVEEGLRLVLEKHRHKRAFKLRPVTVGGRGLRPELQTADFAAIRDLAYEGRGGDRG